MKKRVSDREVAAALLYCLARHKHGSYCCSWVYDYDSEFLESVAKRCGASMGTNALSWIRRIARVSRRLQNANILSGRVSSCHAEYIGEPRVLKSYRFSDPGYAFRIAPEMYSHYTPLMTPEHEIEFLLERF
jgi:hypothetical protein